jgi:peptidoglycan/LPS O-acetylase OafA/YrhL/Zn-finger nucleic acid-binding protein
VGDTSGAGPSRIDALDGLRAVAVVAVLLFHLDLAWMPGGFLGVSLFFTLSGFLITRLLLDESDRTGRVALRTFWARRLRRLSPAALVVLAVVALMSLWGVCEGTRLRGDLGASLGYVANWRFATAESTYAELFTSTPSPVIHFWSLAIEEQFYLVFPVLFVALSKRRALLVPGLLALTIASVVASLFTESRNLGYYGTHVRAAELLIGCLLAVITARRAPSSSGSPLMSIVGGSAFVALLAAMVVVSPSDAWLYRGGLAAVALVSAAVVHGVSRGGPIAWLFARGPMVSLGRASYSIYLVHWPVIVAMTPDRMGFDGWPLDVARIVASVSLGFASYGLIENPVRTRRVLKRTAVGATALVVSMAGVATLTVLVDAPRSMVLAGLDAPDEVVDFAVEDSANPSNGSTIAPVSTPVARPRVLVVGSQLRTGVDISRSNVVVDVVDDSSPGCAFRVDSVDDCPTVSDVVTKASASQPDVIIIGVGLIERRIVRERVEALESTTSVDPVAIRIVEAGKAVDEMLRPFAGLPTIVVDYGKPDAFRGALEDFDLRSDSTVMVVGGNPDRLGAAIEDIVSDARVDLARVMVIGDSSSFGVAQALHNVAADRFEVVWAGGRNCPLVEVERIQWWPDMDFDMDYCPTFDGVWRDMIAEFEPHLVLEIASVPEQAAQRYPGDPNWYTIMDEEYATRHEDVMVSLMEAIDAAGATFVMFDSPYVHGGSLGGAVFADDARVDAWNALMDSWVMRWPVIRQLEWSTIVAEAEATPGELRDDGVHMAQADLDRIVGESVVPRLLEILAEREMSLGSVP